MKFRGKSKWPDNLRMTYDLISPLWIEPGRIYHRLGRPRQLHGLLCTYMAGLCTLKETMQAACYFGILEFIF